MTTRQVPAPLAALRAYNAAHASEAIAAVEACIACGAHCDGTVRGQIGEVTGALCADCAYWCDGNDGNVTAAPPAPACLTCGGAVTRDFAGWTHARKPDRRHVVRVAADAIAAGDREVAAHGGDASDIELPDCRVCGGEMQARNWPSGIGEICTQCGTWHYL